jgi:PAS domain S-box-containing protein
MNLGNDNNQSKNLNLEDLRVSEVRYRRLFEAVRDGILILDFETRKITDVNPYMLEFLGYPREYFLGKELWEIGLLKDEKESAAAFRELQENYYIRYEDLALENRNGEKRQVEFISNVYTENNRQVIQCNIRDITVRLKRDEKLEKLNLEIERQATAFNTLLSSISDMTYTFDHDLRFRYANKSVEVLYGKKLTELIGKNLSDLGFPDASTLEIRQDLQQVFNTGKSVKGETSFPKANGEIGFYEYIFNPVVSNDGLVEMVVGSAREITKRKRAERQIQQLNETLEQRVAERTVELKAANKELEAFSYSVSHDLRAPLRAIDGFSRALLEDYAEQIDETAKNYLERVCAASAHMAQLIEDLLNLSRLSRTEMRRKSVNLSKCVREMADTLQESEPERAVKFDIEDDIIAMGDERLICIALQNLIDNAWKFTSKRERAEIAFGQIRRDDKTEYFVRDNGAGFDMAYADKLFGVFQRLHSVKEFDGTGIGLVTVQRIIHRHGGFIRAEAKPNEGATFYFTL